MALERIRLQFFYRNERTNDLLKIIRVYLLFLKDIFTHEIIKLFFLYVRAKHCNTNCNRYRLFLFSFPPFCSLYLSLFIYSTSFFSLFRLIITAFFFFCFPRQVPPVVTEFECVHHSYGCYYHF